MKGNTPLTGLEVNLSGGQSATSKQQTQTDENGQFQFGGIAVGSYEISVNLETKTQHCKLTGYMLVGNEDEISEDFVVPENFTLLLGGMGAFSDKMVFCDEK